MDTLLSLALLRTDLLRAPFDRLLAELLSPVRLSWRLELPGCFDEFLFCWS